MALRSVITNRSRLFSVSAGAPARLLLGCLARRPIRVLWKTSKLDDEEQSVVFITQLLLSTDDSNSNIQSD